MPIATPRRITIHAPAAHTIDHTSPSVGCCITDGTRVNGHRSKQSTRNITASAVT